MVKKLLIALIVILAINKYVLAVNVAEGWILHSEKYATINATEDLTVINDTGIDKIYVDIFSSQKLYYSFESRIPDLTRDAFIVAGGNFDSQTYVANNQTYGLRAASTTANVVLRRYYQVR